MLRVSRRCHIHTFLLTSQMEREHVDNEDMTVLLRWILGTCLGTCDMDLTDLGHCFVEIIVTFYYITPQKALNRKTTMFRMQEQRSFLCHCDQPGYLQLQQCSFLFGR